MTVTSLQCGHLPIYFGHLFEVLKISIITLPLPLSLSFPPLVWEQNLWGIGIFTGQTPFLSSASKHNWQSNKVRCKLYGQVSNQLLSVMKNACICHTNKHTDGIMQRCISEVWFHAGARFWSWLIFVWKQTNFSNIGQEINQTWQHGTAGIHQLPADLLVGRRSSARLATVSITVHKCPEVSVVNLLTLSW